MRLGFFIALLFAMSSPVMAQASAFRFTAPKGRYEVGLRVVQQYDYSRASKGHVDILTGHPTVGERARPIQTLIWYPASRAGKPLTYRNYVESAATEVSYDLPPQQVSASSRSWVAKRWSGLSTLRIDEELSRPMWAIRDVTPASGKFPVVIYAPSFGASAHENADLCEYLASNGYVVLSSASVGARTRDMTHDLEGAQAQASDIEFLIGYARSLPQADLGHLGVVGYSWGGMANLFAAAQDTRIAAVASLDGSIRYFPTLATAAKYVSPEHLTVPFLYLAEAPRSMEDLIASKQDMSASLINDMRYNDVYLATLYPMTHANFSSEYQRFALNDGWGFAEYTRDETSLAYTWMARYLERFLASYLKNDASAHDFLRNTPVKNGVPNHMISMVARPAAGTPPTIGTLAAALGTQGFDHAEAVYTALRKADPSFQLSEEDLRHWGYQLLWADKNKESVAVFRLVTTLFPDSFNAFDCLAEAYQQDGDYSAAIRNYRKSLELNSANSNATQHLAQLMQLQPGT
jgi:dienelactone hydrolase